MTHSLTIAHSPDSDDIFMAYGLACGAITVPDISFSFVRDDIEILNQQALSGTYPITAISFGAYPYIQDRYTLTTVGASMGESTYGPVVIGRKTCGARPLEHAVIAIPGRYTSAALLLTLALPNAKTITMPFREILPAVIAGRVDAGLLIHESQMQFEDAGCQIVLDLPRWWTERFHLPVPLGTNAIRRDLDPALQETLVTALRDSIRYALEHRTEALQHTQIQQGDQLPISFLDQYVQRYVNQRTLSIGIEERTAVQTLYDAAYEVGALTAPIRAEWV
jgi:1,4-dihydroxy-6-naphthoate synthase